MPPEQPLICHRTLQTHVTNGDAVRHTFVIEGTNVRLEVPAPTERRVEVALAAGEYRFLCDVVGHERKDGVLKVR